jgi:tRNA nucleotidyltransferase (CCA-adding enzyme)
MERVKQELEKTMEQVVKPSEAMKLWRTSGAFKSVVPALAGVSDLTLASIDQVAQPSGTAHPERRIDRLTALFSELSARDAQRALKVLRFSNSDMAWVRDIVERWHAMEPALRAALMSDAPVPAVTLRRWVAMAGRMRVGAVMRLAAARFGAERAAGLPAPTAARVASLYRRMSRAAFHEPVELGDLAVDGDDLRSVGVAAGPAMGKTLAALLEFVLEDPARNTRDALLARVKEIGSAA